MQNASTNSKMKVEHGASTPREDLSHKLEGNVTIFEASGNN